MDHRLPLTRDSFEQILATTWLLQQLQKQAAFLGSTGQEKDDTPQLMELVNTQQAIQTGTLSTEAALLRISALALRLVSAEGAAVWLFAKDAFVYCAGAGSASNDESLKSVVLSKLAACQGAADANANNDLQCAQAKSLLVAPIYQGSRIAGALAVFTRNANSFGERDITATRLLSGLLAHALDKATSARFKDTVNLERAAVLHIIEALMPDLAELVSGEKYSPSKSPLTVASAQNKTVADGSGRIANSSTLVLENEEAAFAPPGIAETNSAFAALFEKSDEAQPVVTKLKSMPEPARIEDLRFAHVTTEPEHLVHETATPTLPVQCPQIYQTLNFDTSLNQKKSLYRFGSAMAVKDLVKNIDLAVPRRAIRRLYRHWGPAQYWLFEVVGKRAKQLEEYGSKINLLLVSGRLPAPAKRIGIGAAVAVTAALAFVALRAGAPKGQPKIRELVTTVHADQPKTDAPVRDGSHRRITDRYTSAAVSNLSRFEIPGLLRQARFGDDSAAFLLGMAYETGRGVPQDCAKAARWVKEAASGGDPAAEYNLSLRYRDGDGVPANSEEAENWLRKAAAHKYPEAETAMVPAAQARAALTKP